MAHGSGPRARRPHQSQRAAGRRRRQVLSYAQDVRVRFEDGKVSQGRVTDAERWAANADRLTGRV